MCIIDSLGMPTSTIWVMEMKPSGWLCHWKIKHVSLGTLCQTTYTEQLTCPWAWLEPRTNIWWRERHNYKPTGLPRRRVQTVSNISMCIHKVFTTVASTLHLPANDNEAQQSKINDAPFGDTFASESINLANSTNNPAGIHVCMKAKRYQNSVHIGSTQELHLIFT